MTHETLGSPLPAATRGAVVVNADTVRLDSRSRVNLAPFKPGSDMFLVTAFDNGTILLVPAMVLPAQQAGRLLQLQDAQLQAGEADAR
jgi:hypothetical protein